MRRQHITALAVVICVTAGSHAHAQSAGKGPGGKSACGLMSADDVVARLLAGANLVQLYTGFVYRGPALLADILQRLNPPPRR